MGRNSLGKKLYKALFQTFCTLKKFHSTTIFCDLPTFTANADSLKETAASVEVMVHPSTSATGAIIDALDDLDLKKRLIPLADSFPLVSYADLH